MNLSRPGDLSNSVTRLQQLFPEVLSEGRVDFDRLRTVLGAADALTSGPEHYELRWAGKAAARQEVQRPSTATLLPDPANSVDFDSTGHVFIEGENLEVLRVLQRGYFSKVKMIYIDPPYNTGNDSFVYPDNYSERREDYEKRTGQRDENGFLNKQDLWKKNTRESGQYHSAWLSMMWPRLYLGRNLLREDGVLFVSIDDHEVHNLRLLLNEVFGEENFVGQWNWFKSATPPNLSRKIKKNIEYILCYQKGSNSKKFKGRAKGSASDDPLTKTQSTFKELVFQPGWLHINDEYATIPAGTYGTEKYPNELLNDLLVRSRYNGNTVSFRNRFVWTQEKLEAEIALGTRLSLSKNLVLSYKKAKYGEEVPPSLIDQSVGVDTTEKAGNELSKLFNGVKIFSYPKPVSLLKYLINFCCDADDLVLDFFAGSGTTGQAVLELNAQDGGNRRFMLVQLPEETGTNTAAHEAGYHTIADITRARLQKVSQQLRARQETWEDPVTDTGFRYYRLGRSNFRTWPPHVPAAPDLLAQLELFQEPLRAATHPDTDLAILTELLLEIAGGTDLLPLSAPIVRREIADLEVHDVADGLIWLALAGINPAVIAAAVAAQPRRLVVPGRFFGPENPDQQVSNARLQLADAGVTIQLI